MSQTVCTDRLAGRGFNLIPIAPNEARLKTIAVCLRDETGRLIEAVPADPTISDKAQSAKIQTVLRSAGISHFADVGLRELNRGGAADIPDVVAAGYHIRSRPADEFFIDFPQLADLRRGVRGTDVVRRMVRAMAGRGVDRINIRCCRASAPDCPTPTRASGSSTTTNSPPSSTRPRRQV